MEARQAPDKHQASMPFNTSINVHPLQLPCSALRSLCGWIGPGAAALLIAVFGTMFTGLWFGFEAFTPGSFTAIVGSLLIVVAIAILALIPPTLTIISQQLSYAIFLLQTVDPLGRNVGVELRPPLFALTQ